MPFDVLNDRRTLADTVSYLGVTPVPMAVLKAHKAAQLRRYRPNLLVTPIPYVAIGALSAVGLVVASLATGTFYPTVLLLAACVGLAAFIISFFLVAMICDLLSVTVRGRAKWVEQYVNDLRRYDVPKPILRVVKDVKTNLPVTLVYGELVQNKTVLDPYLIAQIGDDEICLGIWDGEEVIACATIYGE